MKKILLTILIITILFSGVFPLMQQVPRVVAQETKTELTANQKFDQKRIKAQEEIIKTETDPEKIAVAKKELARLKEKVNAENKQRAEANATKLQAEKATCDSLIPIYCALVAFGEWALALIAVIPIGITSFFVYVSGNVLDSVVLELVVNFPDKFDAANAGIIGTWSTLRDLANIFFIFGLLTIAISTILGLDKYGSIKHLPMIIIMALFINFSLFFTKFIIDISNLFALQFYDGIIGLGSDGTISSVFMDQLGVTSLYDTIPVLESLKSLASIEGGISLVFTYAVLTSIFFMITAFVFMFAAIMLVTRAVGFILLAILSPLAFAAMALPKTENLAKDWWSNLFKYALFAPILFMLFWVTVTVMPDIADSVSLQNGFLSVFSNDSNDRSGAIGLIMNFLILITLMLASIIISNKLSLAGSKGMTEMGKSLGKFASRTALKAPLGLAGAVGRGTIGRAASKYKDSKFVAKLEALSPKLGGVVRTGFEKTAKSSFDVRQPLGKINKDVAGYVGKSQKGGYEETLRKISENRKKTGDHVMEVLGKDKSDKEKLAIRKDFENKLRQGAVADAKDVVEVGKAAITGIKNTVETVRKDGAGKTSKRAVRAAWRALKGTPGFIASNTVFPTAYDANLKAAENMSKKRDTIEIKTELKTIKKTLRDAVQKLEESMRDELDIVNNMVDENNRDMGSFKRKLQDPSLTDAKERVNLERRLNLAETNQINQKNDIREIKNRYSDKKATTKGMSEDRERELQQKDKGAKKIDDAFESKGGGKKNDEDKKDE